MKKITLILVVFILIISCDNKPKQKTRLELMTEASDSLQKITDRFNYLTDIRIKLLNGLGDDYIKKHKDELENQFFNIVGKEDYEFYYSKSKELDKKDSLQKIEEEKKWKEYKNEKK